MAFKHGIKPIVTDGLVFCIDPANKLSYPGSGTTVTDLIGNSNATLQNSPSFENINNGVLDFDGGTERALLGDIYKDTGDMSVSIWFNPQQVDVVNNMIIGARPQDNLRNYATLGTFSDTGGDKLQIILRNPTGAATNFTHSSITTITSTNQWYHLVYCLDRTSNELTAYLNGDSSSFSNPLDISGLTGNPPAGEVYLMYMENKNQYGRHKISSIAIYDKVLSATEAKQNYNALKYRFRT